MLVDERIKNYYNGHIKQVFVYLTSRCQLRCRQCLYKPLLSNDSTDLSFPVLIDLLEQFYEYGARKVSFLGGEPTIYHDVTHCMNFGDVVFKSKRIGYEYVRVDTNGQFASELLEQEQMILLDEITFSIDGHCAELNDAVRGNGTFAKCVRNIDRAVALGYNVQLTSCVHKISCPTAEVGIKNIHQMILFAQSKGVHTINFHPIIKVGIARDAWIDDTNIDPQIWAEVYRRITENVDNGLYKINVRLPMRFTERDTVIQNKSQYFYCPLKMGERALIMPNGQIKVCAFTIGTSACIGTFTDRTITFAKDNNEINQLRRHLDGVCYNQTTDGDLIPLCMSFKPHQNEFVWNKYDLFDKNHV